MSSDSAHYAYSKAADISFKYLTGSSYHNMYKSHAYILIFVDISTIFVNHRVFLHGYINGYTQ